MCIRIWSYSFFFFVLIGQILIAQSSTNNSSSSNYNETGLPFIQNFTPENYNAHGQNWGAVQDSLGILYFANGEGVLSFDGINWEIIALPSQGHAKSIAIDKTNKIYVGASGEFGYLEPDEIGALKYISLSDQLPTKFKDFTTVWQIRATIDGIYFQSNERIFRWRDNHFKVWEIDDGIKFSRIFFVNDTLYFNIIGKGLMYIDQEEIKLAPFGNSLKGKSLTSIIPYSKHQSLVATIDSLYILDDKGLNPFKTDVNEIIRKGGLYNLLQLDNGHFALGTINSGLIIMDNQGKQILSLNNEDVLSSQSIYSLFKDNSGALWATMGFGIAKIDYPSQFSNYSNLGVTSSTFDITRFNNELYAGTDNGLFKLISQETSFFHFENVKELKDRIWNLMVFNDRLLIAWEKGIYELTDDHLNPIGNWDPSSFFRSKIDPNRVFIALANGLGSIYYNEGKWIDEGTIHGITGSTYTILEEPSGNLWLETSEDWVWKVIFEDQSKALKLQQPKLEKIGPNQGLPGDTGNIYMVSGNIYFSSDHGKETYEFDRITNRFKLDETLNSAVGMPDKTIFIEHVDTEENLYFSIKTEQENEKHLVGWRNDQSQYIVKNLNEEQIKKAIGTSMFVELKDSIIWHGGVKGVLRYDLKLSYNKELPYRTLLKKVIYNHDSILVAGVYHSKKFELPYKNNSIRFEFATPSYTQTEPFNYQYKLLDFDEDWSSWSTETKKDYTNLPEGNYTFKVRSKNIFGKLSNEDNYSFTILTPWYRTWWAYLLYSLTVIFLLGFYNRWRSQQMQRKNLMLESLIADRTEEIQNKNELLRLQTEKMKELDTMKTHLFANISHEFRTPLTLIKGPIEKLETDKKNKISTSDIKMIRRNANRLLNLVNQLLDLSKLDSGKLLLDIAEGDVNKCIRAAASAFSSHAVSRNINYQIHVSSNKLWSTFDRDKLEKLVYNLLSNAFKFTPDGFSINITSGYKNNTLQIVVVDSGYGIETEKLSHIFDRFYQVDDSYTKEKEGTGIGLALTKELVGLMNGTITVESLIGKGSTFKVNLPLVEIQPEKDNNFEYSKPKDYNELFGAFENDTNLSSAKMSKVLVIEDNSDMRYYIKEQLLEDYEVYEAINGKDGLLKAAKIMPDLIITDLMMPQMDGITLCKKLKTHIITSHIPIIMLTAKAGIENKLVGLETGVDEYLTKPFNAQELLVRVKNLIRQRQNLRELFSKNISLDPKEVTISSLDDKFLTKILTLLETKYTEPEFDVPQMQKELGMSKTQLHMKTKALTNHPPGVLLRNFRLKRATQLLMQKSDTISQVAYAVGFNSLSYFTKCFKGLYGSSPSEYTYKKRP